ncbi:MAG: nicotinamide riboside transporter PnuC [Pseudomonadota bacterium]
MPSETNDSLVGFDALAQAWAAQSGWEMLAVGLALAYLVLVVRQNPWCWAAALVSTAIYAVLFWDVSLLMQSGLNAYYMAMAVYGWWHWRHGGEAEQAAAIVRWTSWLHGLMLVLIVFIAGLSGYLLDRYTDAALPYLDAVVTWSAVLTTFMVARKVLENWLYWWVINSLAIVLFLDRGLVLTAALHAAYLMIAVVGWRQWLRDYRAQLAGA